MVRPADRSSSTLGRTAAWVLVVQCLLALSWTLYVLFLPGMLATAGIARKWFVFVLIADQAIFAFCDWFAGVYADRVATAWRRVGRAITVTTLLSSAALLAMPWIASSGSAPWLLAVIFVWAATSSALRAPVFALLGRIREAEHVPGRSRLLGRSGVVSMALVGISLAGAIGPYLTLLLKNVDARLPIAISAASLALAGLWAQRAEALLPAATGGTGLSDALPGTRPRAWSLAVIVLVAAFGTQLVTAIVAVPLFQRFVGADAVVWVAWFWAGFGLGLIPGARVAATDARDDDGVGGRALVGAAAALVLASVAFAIGKGATSVATLVAGLAVAGAGWGVFTVVAFTCAVSLSKGRAELKGAGTASGLVFTAIALGTLVRLAFTATGVAKAPLVAWLPEVAWVLASVALVVASRTVWRRPAGPPTSP